jgi:hypothetical protein
VPPSVRAGERALDILLGFTAEEPIQSLTQIAESVHLSKPTVHRLLATLEKKRFIAKDQATSQYSLGIQLHGQTGSMRDATCAQISGRAQRDEAGGNRGSGIDAPGGRNSVAAFAAVAIPKDPQTSAGFNRVGAHE